MQEKFPLMGIVTDRNSAIYQLKNNSGSYDSIPVSSHTFEMHGLNKYVEVIKIQNGLNLFLINIPADVELEMEFQVDECPLGFGVTLECDLDCDYFRDGRHIISEKKTSNSLIISKSNYTYGKTVKSKGTAVNAVSITFDKNLAKVLFMDEFDFLKDEYVTFFGDNDIVYEENHPASSSLLAAASAMLSCSYESPKRELFLKSKVIEMMNYVFAEYFLGAGKPRTKSVLQPGEVEKIKEIRDYIIDRIDMPPTISELSRHTGMNDFKLKAGFKEVFGTTVYGFIQSEKMSRAKMMLETGEHSVSEVAWDVGYTNVSHFIKAFKKQYKITPGQMLFSVKNDIINRDIKYSIGC